jgi:hypothetical protein
MSWQARWRVMHQTRARNPRFYFVHARIAGTKPRFLTKMRHQKIGDSVLCIKHIASNTLHHSL